MGLYSLGPFYPATAQSISESPYSGTNCTWITPLQVSGNGPECATVTNASFDANVKTWVLKAYNFQGFTALPDTATILGVICDINAWTAVGTVHLGLAQLLRADRTKVGTNQFSASVNMSGVTASVYRKGGNSDLWGNALSAGWIKHSGFGVAIGCSAQANNSDVSANWIKLSVVYSVPDAYTISNEGGTIVVSPAAESSEQEAATGTDYAPAIDGATFLGYGGVSTAHFATQPDAGVPVHAFGAIADWTFVEASAGYDYFYDAEVEAVGETVSDRFKTKDYAASVYAGVETHSGRFRTKIYESATQAVSEVASVRFREKKYVSDVQANAAVESVKSKGKIYSGIASAPATAEASAAKTQRWFLPNSLALTAGAIVSGSLEDTYSNNDVYLVLSELLGTPAFQYDFTFGEDEPVPSPDIYVQFRAWYDGTSGHNVKLKQWNYNTSAWVDVTANTRDFSENPSELYYQFGLINDPDYISGGQIKLRIDHVSLGWPTHQMNIDGIALSTLSAYEYSGLVESQAQAAAEPLFSGAHTYTFDGEAFIGLAAGHSLKVAFSPQGTAAGAVVSESALSVSRVASASVVWNVGAASGISAAVGDGVEVGAAAWGLSGGVSTVHFATQRDAGVPALNYEPAAEWLRGASQQSIALDGAVSSAFSVGDATLAYDVVIFPILQGSAVESFTYDSVLDIYSTPVYSAYLIDGTAAWVMAEPVTEYWVDIAGDRSFPLHNFEAAAIYSSISRQHANYAGLADVAFTTATAIKRDIKPTASVRGIVSSEGVYASIVSQQITYAGEASLGAAVETVPERRIVLAAGVDVAFASDHVTIDPYPARQIVLEGSVSAEFTQAGAYSSSLPTAYAVEGGAAFESSALAGKAVANLYEALAEYAAFAGGYDSYRPQYGYSYNYGMEGVPSTAFSTEAQPSQGYTLEPLPPGSLSDESQPSQGYSMESLPNSTYAGEDKPT